MDFFLFSFSSEDTLTSHDILYRVMLGNISVIYSSIKALSVLHDIYFYSDISYSNKYTV